jgi:diaminohydroxyphosphoribosylaminopyrimidine deaminase / 5-amino-6-(5-phosphoribosylamino)uracil reductase
MARSREKSRCSPQKSVRQVKLEREVTARVVHSHISSAGADEDKRFMAAALDEARLGLGLVAPNPAVGALLVKDGAIVGRGHTQPGGRPHAETVALQQAGRTAAGATLYVTLEPCSHHGKTPPCAEAIIAAGVGRVVSATEDPDHRVAGLGHAMLIAAGIEVRTGILESAARRANLGHILRVTVGRPMVTLKMAQTADGFAASQPPGPRLLITGAEANDRVHFWRTQHDAIMVGIGTVLADDPLLTVRLPGFEDRRPVRIILDTKLALSPGSRLAQTAADHSTLVIAADDAPEAAALRLAAMGIEVLHMPRDAAGHIDMAKGLSALGARGLTRIFSEGGPQVATALIGGGFADEVILLTGERKVDGAGVAALDSESRAALGDPLRYVIAETSHIGPDLYQRYERMI